MTESFGGHCLGLWEHSLSWQGQRMAEKGHPSEQKKEARALNIPFKASPMLSNFSPMGSTSLWSYHIPQAS